MKTKVNHKITKPFNNYIYFYIHVFCCLAERLMDKLFIEQILIDQMNFDKKNQAFIVNISREIHIFCIDIYDFSRLTEQTVLSTKKKKSVISLIISKS